MIGFILKASVRAILITSLSLLSIVVLANDKTLAKNLSIAEVVFLKGSAKVIERGTIAQKVIHLGDSISNGDVIVTEDKSILRIKLVDESLMTFGPNTKFNFRNYKYTNGKNRVGSFELVMGQMRGKFSKMEKGKSDIKISTASASLGIRGTEVLLNSVKKNKKHFTQASLVSGKAILKEKGSGQVYELLPGAVIVAMYVPSTKKARGGKFELGQDVQQALASADVHKNMNVNSDSGEFALAGAKDGEGDMTADELAKDLFLDVKEIDKLKW